MNFIQARPTAVGVTPPNIINLLERVSTGRNGVNKSSRLSRAAEVSNEEF